ncbi:hypothetical protein H477_3392 [[Clostridium] sordellii ATCC 9714]|nr:hypothetical protein H477_3392 [[Clostridium] sordellii ATCC 9714] [Paeniclostridium sordellii ATCC 9714]
MNKKNSVQALKLSFRHVEFTLNFLTPTKYTKEYKSNNLEAI